MKPNLDNTARIVRISMAAIILILFLTNVISGVVAYVLLAMAAMMLLTGLMRFCPMAMVGICPERFVRRLFAAKSNSTDQEDNPGQA